MFYYVKSIISNCAIYRDFPNTLANGNFYHDLNLPLMAAILFFFINVGDYRACIGKRSNTFLVVFPILL